MGRVAPMTLNQWRFALWTPDRGDFISPWTLDHGATSLSPWTPIDQPSAVWIRARAFAPMDLDRG